MEHFTKLLTYSERPAANCNRDPKVVNAKFDPIRRMRERAAALLENPRVVGDHRREVEMIYAKADRLLKSVETHRRDFNQHRLLAKMRPL